MDGLCADNACSIRASEGDEKALRLSLCLAVKNVLGTALHLIGLKTPEKI
jgi:arginyl-tRNA synthetase